MVKIPVEIKNSIDRYYQLLLSIYKNVLSIYLYGSYAKGDHSSWSDIDIAVVSDDFSNDYMQNQIDLMKLAVQIDDRIEPHAFRSDEFTINNPVAFEIMNNGILLNG